MTARWAAPILCGAAIALPAAAQDSDPPLDILLASSEAAIGQPYADPDGAARIAAAIVTMAPDQSTGWQRHQVPLFGYVLEGKLTVDDGADGTRICRAGDSLIEAFETLRNGTNTGAVPVRLLAVFAEAEGVANTPSEA